MLSLPSVQGQHGVVPLSGASRPEMFGHLLGGSREACFVYLGALDVGPSITNPLQEHCLEQPECEIKGLGMQQVAKPI